MTPPECVNGECDKHFYISEVVKDLRSESDSMHADLGHIKVLLAVIFLNGIGATGVVLEALGGIL